jgi:MFS family permease
MPGIRAEDRKWWVLAAMGAILGVILLDETVVSVALATIRSDLGMSEAGSHWVVNIYMLVLAGLSAAAGKVGDIAGHRLVMNSGLLTFGAASIACGFADSGTWLIVARGVQGVGAAIIFPASLAMLTIAFPERQRGLAIGISGAVGTVFLALGPLVGGFLTDFASCRLHADRFCGCLADRQTTCMNRFDAAHVGSRGLSVQARGRRTALQHQ